MDGECSDFLTELESWYARESGCYLLGCIGDTLQGLLDTSFGYHILQLGVTRGQPLFEGSPINHRIYSANCPGDAISLICDADELPLESDSVDAVIAHHSLEFTAHPHQVLREIQRVLTPQGQLLVIGFNPYSLAGMGQYLRGFSRNSLWHHHRPVSERRLTDWLHLLGCEVQGSSHLYSMPPAGGTRLRRWLTRADQWCNRHNLPVGGLYVLQAIKQQPAMHRRRQLRLSSEGLIGLAVPKPKTAPSPTPNAPVHRQPGHKRGDAAA
jgi:SAM-dependent methyltransferase